MIWILLEDAMSVAALCEVFAPAEHAGEAGQAAVSQVHEGLLRFLDDLARNAAIESVP